MGDNRKIWVVNKQGIFGCPDLFCNVHIRGKGYTEIISLSLEEAKGLIYALNKEVAKNEKSN